MKIATDPEILLVDGGGVFRSVIGHLPPKHKPLSLKGGKCHADNVAAEFSTEPVDSATGFSFIVYDVLQQMLDYMSDSMLAPSEENLALYPDEELTSLEAQVAGCNVDWNAYTEQMNEIPDYSVINYRCAGGHLHIDTDKRGDALLQLIKTLDLLITVPMLRAEGTIGRRQWYGKAGSFRVTRYGIEYRTPSNVWVFTDDRRRWVAEQIEKAILIPNPDLDYNIVRSVVDAHDTDQADALVCAHNIPTFPV